MQTRPGVWFGGRSESSGYEEGTMTLVLGFVVGMLAAGMFVGPVAWAATITTPPGRPATQVPVVPVPPPSDLTATAGIAKIDLAWRDQSAGKAGFRIERRTATGGHYVDIMAVGPGTVRFTDTAAPAGVTCVYRVRAVMAQGREQYLSPYSNEAWATVVTSVAPVEFTMREIALVGQWARPVEFAIREIVLVGTGN
jgi:hypothetical protein